MKRVLAFGGEVESSVADRDPKGAHGGEAPALDATLWSRRDIFSLAGWAGFFGVLGASASETRDFQGRCLRHGSSSPRMRADSTKFLLDLPRIIP